MFYVNLGQITRWCAILFSRFSIFFCINLYFIVHFKIKRKIDFEKSDAILVAVNKRININSNEASWARKWEAAQVLLHV